MKIERALRLLISLIAFEYALECAPLGATGPQEPGTNNLFVLVEPSSPDMLLANSSAGGKAERQDIGISLHRGVTDGQGIAEGTELLVPLPDRRPLLARVERSTTNASGTLTLRASIMDYPSSYILISRTGKDTIGTLNLPELGSTYTISAGDTPDSLCLVLQEDLHFDPSLCGPDSTPPPPTLKEQSRIREIAEKIKHNQQDLTELVSIDVMVVYTPAARLWATNRGGILNHINQAMEEANFAHEASQTGIRLRLVHSAEVEYTEAATHSEDLSNVTYGQIPRVNFLRDAYGADLVALFIDNNKTNVAGTAWTLNHSSGRPDFGFSVTSIQYAHSQYVHAHELGHNMGLGHHKDQSFQPGPGVFPYSAGWRWRSANGERLCCLMTYSSGSYFTDGETHARVARFSNPAILIDGVPTGHESDGDSARSLREVSHAIAAYRSEVVIPPDGWSLTLLAEHGTVFAEPHKARYEHLEAVTLTASPDPGRVFTGWTGELAGTEAVSPTTLIMRGNHSVGANFVDPFSGGFETWARLMNLPEGHRGPLDRYGPLQLPNGLAYAMALDPKNAVVADLPRLDLGLHQSYFRYRRARQAAEALLQPQVSEDLKTWREIDLESISTVDSNELWETVEVPILALPNEMQFFRLLLGAVPIQEGFVRVDGGTLLTSSHLNGTLVPTFLIKRYEVTWSEWKTVREWAKANGYDIGNAGEGCAEDHPVRSVSWYDALKWCNARSQMEGLEPVYTLGDAVYTQLQPPRESIVRNLSANGFRLPTEAEWEFAARGGNQTEGYDFSGSNHLDLVAWHMGNSIGSTCNLLSGSGTWPVGQKSPNELGIHDMTGNVSEWCWDLGSNGFRLPVVRGGGWHYIDENRYEVSYSGQNFPNSTSDWIGFRIARNLVPLAGR